MTNLAEQVRESREAARTAAAGIRTRAADEQRDLTADEWAEHERHATAERAAGDELDRLRDAEIADLRASVARRPSTAGPRADAPVLTREQSVTDWCRTRGMLGEGDHDDLSLTRYLRGVATGDWSGAEHERALSEGVSTAGGVLVPTPLASRVIDLARNRTRVFQAGAVTVPMTTQTVKLARLTGEGTPGWKTEGAAITANSDLAFDSVTLTAKTLTRVITLSVELFEDADPASDSIVASSFAAQFALELDRAALRGSGTTPEPRGVLNTSGITVTTHGANGATIATAGMQYDFLIDAVAAVRANNFEPNAQIDAPRTEASLAKLKDTTTQYLQPPPGLPPRYATKTVPINLTVGTSVDTSEVYTADWSNLLVGMRTNFNIKFLAERYIADTLSYAFVAYMRADVALAQPSAFVVDTGVRG